MVANGKTNNKKSATVALEVKEAEEIVYQSDNEFGDNYMCPKCGFTEWQFGSFPSCKGNKEDHVTNRSRRNAGRVLTYYYINAEGKIMTPAGDRSVIPPGYERRDLYTIQEVDKFTSDVNKVSREIAEAVQEERTREWEEQYNANRFSESEVAAMTPAGRDAYRYAQEKYGRMPEFKHRGEDGFFIASQYYDRNNIDQD